MIRAALILGISVTWVATSPGQVWDVVDETYGNGIGQISLISTYDFPWSDTPGETPSDGSVQLTHGAGIDYAVRFDADATFDMPSDGTWTMEIKMQLHGAMGGTLYLADNYSPRWSSLVTINHLYSETVPHPNTIGDYNQRVVDGTDIAPGGFDGSAVHTYRFERFEGSAVEMFVDDVSLGTLTPGAGAVGDAAEIEIGFGGGMSTGPGTTDVYYVKVAGPPAMVEFADVAVGDAMAMEFQSVLGTEYRLESTDQVVTNWQFAGMVLMGDGNTMHMYDPAGHSTQKVYRIVAP